VWAPILAALASESFTVLAFDYRGYGLSTGRPSEGGLYRDVDAIVQWALQADSPLPIVYWGRSLGATMAAYAATVRRPSGLILEAGFPDARSLVRGSPPLALLALFSDRDRVIPFALGRQLFDAVPGPKEFLVIRNGDHNDLAPPDSRQYWRSVELFIDTLR
jgi:fermentation-respiration switch protein FrsA (DUF1100 family)